MVLLLSFLLAAPTSLVGETPPPPPVESSVDRERAIRNYQAIANGALRFQDLTSQEQAEVSEVDRLVRARQRQGPEPSAAERCRHDEQSAQPSSLERALTDLKCAGR